MRSIESASAPSSSLKRGCSIAPSKAPASIAAAARAIRLSLDVISAAISRPTTAPIPIDSRAARTISSRTIPSSARSSGRRVYVTSAPSGSCVRRATRKSLPPSSDLTYRRPSSAACRAAVPPGTVSSASPRDVAAVSGVPSAEKAQSEKRRRSAITVAASASTPRRSACEAADAAETLWPIASSSPRSRRAASARALNTCATERAVNAAIAANARPSHQRMLIPV